MSLINNIKIKGEILQFDLLNKNKEIKISLANALRRTFISDIYVYAVDYESINFIENSSVLNNEFLKDRLLLIPIISDVANINYDNILLSCKKENNNEYIESLYVSDFECKDSVTDEIIDNNILFKYPGILFAKIKTNQKIHFEAKLKSNNADNGGSFYSPVSQCTYTFKIDSDEVTKLTKTMSASQKKTFMTQDVQRYYKKNDSGEPETYEFTVESIGMMDVKKIYKMGVNKIIEHLLFIESELKNKNSKKITFLPNSENETIFQILFDNETETLGNILSQYLTYDANVLYCSYLIEHPLKKNIILKIKLNKNNNLDTIILLLEEYIKYIMNILNKIEKQFD
jgi:DNA-directed RNA polymerase subunit L/DNA-directed RNA polymerase alpha subunit